MLPRPLITLTTDFGLADPFVGIMKGVILGINPAVEFVDLSHEVAAHDVLDAAFTLFESYRFFPDDTIHLVVVDPGVGSARRPLLVQTLKYKFVAPDNGVLSLIYDHEESIAVRHITAGQYFLNPVSNTFHGRDVFAPVAAWLSRGIGPDKFGDLIDDYLRTSPPQPQRLSATEVRGAVLKIDRFGNVITNLTPQDVPELFREKPPAFKIIAHGHKITRLVAAYAMADRSEVVAVLGSSGFLELAMNQGAAGGALGVSRGSEVTVVLGS